MPRKHAETYTSPSDLAARLNAAAPRPLTIAPRSARCENALCNEIRAAYARAQGRAMEAQERTAGED